MSHESWLSEDPTFGTPVYGDPVSRVALVDWNRRMVRTTAGETTVCRATVTFLEDIVIDERDRITLPDGTVAPILDISGFVDRATGRGFLAEVLCG